MKPIRCCVACKSRKNKEDLFRIVADNNNHAIIDKNQNINSRGIYVCKNKQCIKSLEKIVIKNRMKLKIDVENESMLEVLRELGEEIWEN